MQIRKQDITKYISDRISEAKVVSATNNISGTIEVKNIGQVSGTLKRDNTNYPTPVFNQDPLGNTDIIGPNQYPEFGYVGTRTYYTRYPHEKGKAKNFNVKFRLSPTSSEDTILSSDYLYNTILNSNLQLSLDTTQSNPVRYFGLFNTPSFVPFRLTFDKTDLVNDEQATGTLSGGRQGVAVRWQLTGDYQIVSQQNAFDANGNAKIVVKGRTPFERHIGLTVTSDNQVFGATVTIRYIVRIVPNLITYRIGSGASTAFTLTGGMPNGKFSIKWVSIIGVHQGSAIPATEYTFDSTGSTVLNAFPCRQPSHNGLHDQYILVCRGEEFPFSIKYVL